MPLTPWRSRIFYLVLGLISVVLSNGGCAPSTDPVTDTDSTNLSPEIYAKLLRLLPGAQTVDPAEFANYRQQGRLKVLSESEINKDTLIAGAQLGLDAATLTEYIGNNPGQEDLLKRKISSRVPATHRFINKTGKYETIRLMDNESRIQTVAATIRSAEDDRSASVSAPVSRFGFSPTLPTSTGFAAIDPINCGEGSYVSGPAVIGTLNWTLKPYTGCIKNQSIRGTCSAFATTAVVECSVAAKYGKWISLSNQALYNYGKMFWQVGGIFTEGITVETYFKYSLNNNYRIPFLGMWTYNPSFERQQVNNGFTKSCVGFSQFCSDASHQGKLVCTQPSSDIFNCGFLTQISDGTVGVKITSYEQIWNFQTRDQSLDLAATYLTAGFPIVLEFLVNTDFLNGASGFIQAPSNNEETLGEHAVALVGYITQLQLQSVPGIPAEVLIGNENYFIAKNSWGTDWGDSGYVLIPTSYLRQYALSLLAVKGVDLRETGEES